MGVMFSYECWFNMNFNQICIIMDNKIQGFLIIWVFKTFKKIMLNTIESLKLEVAIFV